MPAWAVGSVAFSFFTSADEAKPLEGNARPAEVSIIGASPWRAGMREEDALSMAPVDAA